MTAKRCWGKDDLMIAYHDTEWGVPVHDDRTHFEYIVLDSAQAGLSWATILKRREGYRRAFAGFDPAVVAGFDEARIEAALQDPGIIRNRLKVVATVGNARAFLQVQAEFGSFDRYIWQFTGGKTIVNHWASLAEVPAETPESQAMSRDLMKRGFRFVGPTICYAYMQAAGMVNDHITECFRHDQLSRLAGERASSRN